MTRTKGQRALRKVRGREAAVRLPRNIRGVEDNNWWLTGVVEVAFMDLKEVELCHDGPWWIGGITRRDRGRNSR
ncbi:hypothetical protein CC1G_14448 [Coprinopsis cinerea okayama7|uniref:Uncharacterized protein n=1 Tax=Coprinopsis cinerea (strain Okayama-7 / 130 / ATCC MYA-4618 / FGSC 9003) TaxID=240176 RepID=D6RLU3_COPC7|nr:hypothetical protein CC1G_14448 [Coprinopsis cinerea okayama7\|eukprot:XP_002911451.1 hypothetical protein CC1G_14448 [Coprinopsis cinerea okayama7\